MAKAQFRHAQFSGSFPDERQVFVPLLESPLHEVNDAAKSRSIQHALDRRQGVNRGYLSSSQTSLKVVTWDLREY